MRSDRHGTYILYIVPAHAPRDSVMLGVPPGRVDAGAGGPTGQGQQRACGGLGSHGMRRLLQHCAPRLRGTRRQRAQRGLAQLLGVPPLHQPRSQPRL